MDYKKLIKSRSVRLAILKGLRFVPDRPMIKLQYRIKTGRRLDLKNPRRFTEKLQWYKLFYKDPAMVQCVDKYDVRAYVERKGLGHILNECYGVYDRVEDIDFQKLPRQFVLKDTLGSGGNSVIVVTDQSAMDLDGVKAQLRKWVGENNRAKSGGREWPYYSGKKHRILAERLIAAEAQGGPVEFKFLCFQGKAEYLYVLADRDLGNKASLGIFDKDYHRLPGRRMDEAPLECSIPKPKNFDSMREMAQKLAEDFPHARIDFYNENGQIVFGEITFFDGSGYMKFEPDELDFDMGGKFILQGK